MMSVQQHIDKFNVWREHHISQQQFVLFLSVIIGLITGVAAYLMKTFVIYLKDFLIDRYEVDQSNLLLYVYPMAGILLTVFFLRWIVRDDVRHGIPRILYVISKKGGEMRKHKTFSSFIGGALTSGFGGSAGLESPIISTGASVGSTFASAFNLNFKTKTLLIGAGAAGAMASIFTTPIAAVIFSMEVLMLDLTAASILPLLISSVTGAITAKLLMSDEVLFHFSLDNHFEVPDLPFYILLGILAGFVSLYFNRSNYVISKWMNNIKDARRRTIVGMLLMGLLIFIFPVLFGEGYNFLKIIIDGDPKELTSWSFFYDYRMNFWIFSAFLFLVLLLKIVATTLTIESGGVGGIFAPAVFTGGITGYLFSSIVNHFDWLRHLNEKSFTLVGMAAVLGAVLHAPLTAIFFAAEITNGYHLMLPLMLTTSVAYSTIKLFDSHSIFNRQLAERGQLLTHHKDKAVLTLLAVSSVIDKDFNTIGPEASLGDLVKEIAHSKRNIFPIIKEDNTFIGLIAMDDVREDMFKPELYSKPAIDYMMQPKDSVSSKQTMEMVMQKFNETDYYNLPVIDDGKYVGFVSRSNVFLAYRKTLLEVSLD
ncbi:MAG: chloride channel protein [Bacteroidales bacterium]|nr:chloride channel protein [Bacteroidales bacterium]